MVVKRPNPGKNFPTYLPKGKRVMYRGKYIKRNQFGSYEVKLRGDAVALSGNIEGAKSAIDQLFK